MNLRPLHDRPRSVAGFTLVEILTVIVIIGVLAGLAVPAAVGVLEKARNTSVKVEVDLLGQSLEAYKLRYGSYPPDFSDWNKVERHFRKAFPQIADQELKILAQFTHLDSDFRRVPVTGSGTVSADPRSLAAYTHYRHCIDPAEALVFSLGGFSDDAKRPFTGPGGPLDLVSGITVPIAERSYYHYQYNINRENFDFEFDAEGLGLVVVGGPDDPFLNNPLGGGIFTYSDDELNNDPTGNSDGDPPVRGDYTTRAEGSAFAAVRYLLDPFPTYTKGSDSTPLVYFAEDSYESTFAPSFDAGSWMDSGAFAWHNLNYHAAPSGNPEDGVARPYFSDQIDTSGGGFVWEGNGKYQIISAGQDNSYGGSISSGTVLPSDATTYANAGNVTVFPTGRFANLGGLSGSDDKYEDPTSIYLREKPQLDNIASFSTLTFEDELE